MKKLLGVAFLLFVFACEDEGVDELLPIDSTIELEVTEAIIENQSQVLILMSTEKEYPCLNYPLVTAEEMKTASFSVAVLGVKSAGENCFTALGPAIGSINLGNLANGVYELVIKIGSFTNEGTVEVTENEIRLDFPEPKGLSVLTPSVER